MKISKNHILLGMSVLTFLIITSCKKLIEVGPPVDKITTSNVYNSDAGAASVITGIYLDFSLNEQIAVGDASVGFLTGLSSDELTLKSTNTNNDWAELYGNNLINSSNGSGNLWGQLYSLIFRVNSAIDGINKSKDLTASGKKELLAEAQFLRGFLYFYLVNLYGDVPLVTNSNVTENSNTARTSIDKVYAQIVLDLINAKANLSANYLNGDIATISSERVRPNTATASALLARVYLYTSKWAEAEAEATNLINNSNYQLEPLEKAFKINSKEAIWQLQRRSSAQASDAGDLYFPLNGNAFRTYCLSSQITDSFELGDNRKIQWVYSLTDGEGTFNYPYKYRDGAITDPSQITEYAIVFRLSEQYLIRAEARARQGKIIGTNSAKSDIDVVRVRAGLAGTIASTQEDMINMILKEKKIELFSEWGHRWLDLKRTGKVNEIMNIVTPQKGGSWSSFKSLYPIPLSEIQKDPALSGHQNPGY